MPRAGPKKVQAYSAEFKLAAVRLSRQRGAEVQAVAAAPDIPPFMLSRGRKEVRDGRLGGGRAPAVKPPPTHHVRRPQARRRRAAPRRAADARGRLARPRGPALPRQSPAPSLLRPASQSTLGPRRPAPQSDLGRGHYVPARRQAVALSGRRAGPMLPPGARLGARADARRPPPPDGARCGRPPPPPAPRPHLPQ